MLRKRLLWNGVAALLFVIVAGCGGKTHADVSIFVMTQNGLTAQTADVLRASLHDKVGDQLIVSLDNSFAYSLEKLVLEISSGKHDIYIVPNERFLAMAGPNRYVDLDAEFIRDDYPNGVLEIADGETTTRHLYGVPIGKSNWFIDAGLLRNNEYAFIPVNSKHKEDAKTVLKLLMQ